MFGRYMQQKRHRLDQSGTILHQPVRQRGGVPLLPVSQIGDRAGVLVIVCHGVIQQVQGLLRQFRLRCFFPAAGEHTHPGIFSSLAAGKGAHRTVRFRFNGQCVFSSAGGQAKGQYHAQNRREKAAPEQILHHPASFSECPAAAAAAAPAFAVGAAAAAARALFLDLGACFGGMGVPVVLLCQV